MEQCPGMPSRIICSTTSTVLSCEPLSTMQTLTSNSRNFIIEARHCPITFSEFHVKMTKCILDMICSFSSYFFVFTEIPETFSSAYMVQVPESHPAKYLPQAVPVLPWMAASCSSAKAPLLPEVLAGACQPNGYHFPEDESAHAGCLPE